jgi:c(7)-type cytochrome triheme protein
MAHGRSAPYVVVMSSLIRSRGFVVSLLLLAFAPFALAQMKGVKKRRPAPDEFGTVVMNNASEKNGVAPVVFAHWLHRAKYTCRLCHVDIGFAMQANATQVREDDNRNGAYCGACHNGKIAFAVQLKKGSLEETKNCDRCHAKGRNMTPSVGFAAFTSGLPRGRFGNNVDWEAAELSGKVTLVDTLPEISVKRRPLDIPKDYTIQAKVGGLPEIIFSHKKHAVWNGCELCHPDLYAVKAGATKYAMEDVFEGKFCGACHGSVAFPATDCQRCHVKPVVG